MTTATNYSTYRIPQESYSQMATLLKDWSRESRIFVQRLTDQSSKRQMEDCADISELFSEELQTFQNNSPEITWVNKDSSEKIRAALFFTDDVPERPNSTEMLYLVSKPASVYARLCGDDSEKGSGTALVKELIHRCTRADKESLVVSPSMTSHQFYTKLGFVYEENDFSSMILTKEHLKEIRLEPSEDSEKQLQEWGVAL